MGRITETVKVLLIANIILGVSEGFSKTLELNGTGYRASV